MHARGIGLALGTMFVLSAAPRAQSLSRSRHGQPRRRTSSYTVGEGGACEYGSFDCLSGLACACNEESSSIRRLFGAPTGGGSRGFHAPTCFCRHYPSPPPNPPPAPPPPPLWTTDSAAIWNAAAGTLAKSGGANNDYSSGWSVSTSAVTALTTVAPTGFFGQSGGHYYRLCLTTDVADDHQCGNGLFLGFWPDGRIFTKGTCAGKYSSTYVGGEALEVKLDGANLRASKDGVGIRSCAATPGVPYFAKVFMYKNGAQLSITLTPVSGS
jgi:hypothetical protein